MKLYRAARNPVVEFNGRYYSIKDRSFDSLVCDENLLSTLKNIVDGGTPLEKLDEAELQAPVGNQEVWASGVTYYRSRNARIEESEGGGDFYDLVYSAERPELFFKSMPHKVVGHRGKVKIRSDAKWSVPEPELALLINPKGEIIGYTIGNDMSSRDIEGANPLYLPQAKVYDSSCALGPGVLVQEEAPSRSTTIQMDIVRNGEVSFTGSTTLAELKREFKTLVDYLFRDHSFQHGCYLLTGTGIVPPDVFTLQAQDEIRISIEGVGVLINTVA